MSLMNKAGRVGFGLVDKAITGIISLVVLFLLYAELVPEAQTAGNTLNAAGVPLGSLFVGGGLVFIIIMVGLLILVVRSFMPGKGRK